MPGRNLISDPTTSNSGHQRFLFWMFLRPPVAGIYLGEKAYLVRLLVLGVRWMALKSVLSRLVRLMCTEGAVANLAMG